MTSLIKIDAGAAELLAQLHSAGFAAYVVGGCVRDSLLGLVPHDWDLCTAALPEQVMELFGKERCIPTGLKHGTVTVKRGGKLYEITTFRTEGAYSDGRHPDSVSFVPEVRSDLSRRDFTINAMAYSYEQGLIDPFGGRGDLEKRLVRAVGCPEHRFEEDALRIMRLYRFAARFGFAADAETEAAAIKLAGSLKHISAERIQDELCRLLCAPKPSAWLEPEIFAVILPELGKDALIDRRSVIDAVPPDLPVRLAALLAPLGEEGARAALRGLKCSNSLTNETALLVSESGVTPESGDAARTLQARRLLNKMDMQTVRRLLALGAAERPGCASGYEALMRETEKQSALNACCRIGQLAVNGKDIMALGVPAGAQIRAALEELLELVMTDSLPNTREALIGWLQNKKRAILSE